MNEKRLPQSLDEIDRDLVKVNKIDRRVAAINSKLEAEITRLREMADTRKQPLLDERKALVSGAKTSSAVRKEELVREHGKTIRLKKSGWVISWRWVSSVMISGKLAPIIAALERDGHNECVIVKKTLNRRALGMRPDIVKKLRNVRIDRTENHSVYRPEEK